VFNRDWQEINEANNAWMAERGITTFTDEAEADWNRRIKEKWPYSTPPSEEEPCCECEGEGEIETWVPLLDALQDLGWEASGEPEEWDGPPPPNGIKRHYVQCSCGKRTTTVWTPSEDKYIAQDKNWVFKNNGWTCGEEGHAQASVQAISTFFRVQHP